MRDVTGGGGTIPSHVVPPFAREGRIGGPWSSRAFNSAAIRGVRGLLGIRRDPPGSTGIHRDPPGSTRIHRDARDPPGYAACSTAGGGGPRQAAAGRGRPRVRGRSPGCTVSPPRYLKFEYTGDRCKLDPIQCLCSIDSAADADVVHQPKCAHANRRQTHRAA
eukprot:5724471-Prymnesium_polylepis.2